MIGFNDKQTLNLELVQLLFAFYDDFSVHFCEVTGL